jgi:uncharacterized protein (TIRG00374 family)
MALPLTPRLLRRGLQLFALISIVGVVAALVVYGNNLGAFVRVIFSLRWGWVIVGLGLASMDWLGGGSRLWVITRHVHPAVRWRDMVISGGMGAWGAYLTPFQSGAGPTMMWTMRRAGVGLPEAMTSTFMSFVATVIFFAVAGPLAIGLGAGRSLQQHGVVLGLTLYDLFKTSLLIFVVIGIVMAFAMFFPRLLRDIVHWLATRLQSRSQRVATRIDHLRDGIDRAHECMVEFGSPSGLLALLWATILSGPSHANKLLAGYVAMRALGLPAHFVDVLLVQTLITFLLYFAPTPGASGLAEMLSAAVMSIYVPRELLGSYTFIWRFINSYATVIFGALLFWHWLRTGLVGRGEAVGVEPGALPPVP